MTYVIQSMDTGRYAAPLGSEHSYTRYLQEARTFTTREDAKRECCGNERILSLDEAMQSARV